MDTIIKKAVDAGWTRPCIEFIPKGWSDSWKIYTVEKYVLDPLFWQALARVSKWEKELLIDDEGQIRNMVNNDMVGVIPGYYQEESWLFYAQRFYRINLTEGWDAAISYLSAQIPEK